MKKTLWIVSVVVVAAAVFGGYFAFEWFFCRFTVPAGSMAVVTAKNGSTPAPGTLLVERGEKGIWKDVLAEGRHFLNPFFYEVKIVPALTIPLGKVGVVTSKVGKELPSGEVIAPDDSYKGVRRDVLGPGTYRLNPEGYQISVVDALSIPVGYVGVVTSQTGKLAPEGDFAKLGEKGVMEEILQPGLYYVNPVAYQVNVIEIGMNQVSMSGREGGVISGRNFMETADSELNRMQNNALTTQQERRLSKALAAPDGERSEQVKKLRQKSSSGDMAADTIEINTNAGTLPKVSDEEAERMIYGLNSFVEFPSRDGFKIMIDMTVEFEFLPENISRIYLLYGDLPQVVNKIILPQVLSISRLKGSSYRAQDFIMGEGREIFQNNLRQELIEAMRAKGIQVHNAIIRNVEIPIDILTPIRESSLAQEQNLTNQSLQETAKMEAQLNTENALIEQKRKEVQQETTKLVAEIEANTRNTVANIQAETEVAVASIGLEKASVLAEMDKVRGSADAYVAMLPKLTQLEGTKLKAKLLGSAGEMTMLQLTESLNPDVRLQIIYAGEGTMWTDLKNGTVALPAPATTPVPAPAEPVATQK